MDRQAVEEAIVATLQTRRNKVVNRNALQALFGAVMDPVNSLGKVFLGRQDALDTERARIAQDIMLDLLCKMDDAIRQAQHSASNSGVTRVTGLIEATAEHGDQLVGADISAPAELGPGFHVKVSSSNVKNVTGLRITNNQKE